MKLCPFCGSQPKLYHFASDDERVGYIETYTVHCVTCNAKATPAVYMPFGSTNELPTQAQQRAWDNWERRHDSST